MAGHGKLKTIPADPGLRSSGVRGFLLQFSQEDFPITQWGRGRGLSLSPFATNLPFSLIWWHVYRKRNMIGASLSSIYFIAPCNA